MGREQQIRLARHAAGGDIDHHRDGLAIGLAMAQRGERVGGLAALADEQREPALLEHRVAVAKLARDIDIDRHAGELLEPVFRYHARVIGGAAGDDGHPADARDVEIELRQRDRIVRLAQIRTQRLRDHGRLFEDLFLHEVAIIALLDRGGRGARGGHLTLDRRVLGVVDRHALALQHDPVAFLEIGDLLGQRRQCQRIGA